MKYIQLFISLFTDNNLFISLTFQSVNSYNVHYCSSLNYQNYCQSSPASSCSGDLDLERDLDLLCGDLLLDPLLLGDLLYDLFRDLLLLDLDLDLLRLLSLSRDLDRDLDLEYDLQLKNIIAKSDDIRNNFFHH